MNFYSAEDTQAGAGDVPRCGVCSRPVTVDGNGRVRPHYEWMDPDAQGPGKYRMPRECGGAGKLHASAKARR